MSYLNPPHVPAPCVPADLIEVDAHRIDDRRAGALQVLERRREHLDDLGIGRVALVGLAQDADPRAFQAVFVAAPRE